MREPGESRSRRFLDWLDGERESKDQTLFVMERRPPRLRPTPEEHARRERHRLRKFLGIYPVLAGLVCLTLTGILLYTVVRMPGFGQAGSPLHNEVAEHYLEYTERETGATNAVTGMILSYRGFDTLGESCVLFLAVACVMLLLERDGGEQAQRLAQEEAIERAHPDLILRRTARLLTPLCFLFALYVLLNGETSPGGGFSGGTILGGGLILYAAAYGPEGISSFFSRRVYLTVRTLGLSVYALLYGYYIFMGANGLESHISPLWGGLNMPIDLAVGAVVACTVYGFYALFRRGSLE